MIAYYQKKCAWIRVDENCNKCLKEQQTDHAAMNENLDKTVLLETELAEAIEAKNMYKAQLQRQNISCLQAVTTQISWL